MLAAKAASACKPFTFLACHAYVDTRWQALRKGRHGPFKWQAEKWSAVISRSGGGVVAHCAMAEGQRGWKWQPDGGCSGEGISPLTGMKFRFLTSSFGSDASSACV